MATRRVIGCGQYDARWVGDHDLVELKVRGVLPCTNAIAQLERRVERVSPPMWTLVFFVQSICAAGSRPFALDAVMLNSSGASAVIVHDAAGCQEVPIRAPDAPTSKPGHHRVFARLPPKKSSPHDCLLVPDGTLVPATHYCAFGPAPQDECREFVERLSTSAPEAEPLDPMPWPPAR